MMTLMLNIAIPTDLQHRLGWVVIVVVSVNIIVNLSAVGIRTSITSYLMIRRYVLRKKIEAKFEKREKMRSSVSKNHNLELTYFEMQSLYASALKQMADWQAQRKWLASNGIKADRFMEEKCYEELN